MGAEIARRTHREDGWLESTEGFGIDKMSRAGFRIHGFRAVSISGSGLWV